MKDSRLVRAATLVFAVGSLVFLVAHASLGAGCAATPAARALPPPATNAQASPGSHEGSNPAEPTSAPTQAVPAEEAPPPSYLGATKAAAVYRPPQAQNANGKP